MSEWLLGLGQSSLLVSVGSLAVAAWVISLLCSDAHSPPAAPGTPTRPATPGAATPAPALPKPATLTLATPTRAPPDLAVPDPAIPANNPAAADYRAAIARLTNAQLCAALRRSYRPAECPAGITALTLVAVRGYLFDELERRDPIGFALWLASTPSVGSDPGGYLTARLEPTVPDRPRTQGG